MRHAIRLLAGGVLALCAAAPATNAHAQASTPSSYSSAESDFVVGRNVYLRSSKTLIGTITKADEAHSFPRSFRLRHSPAKAVLIRRKDGPFEWTPIEGITRIYVVGK